MQQQEHDARHQHDQGSRACLHDKVCTLKEQKHDARHQHDKVQAEEVQRVPVLSKNPKSNYCESSRKRRASQMGRKEYGRGLLVGLVEMIAKYRAGK